MLLKQKGPSIPRNLAIGTFGKTANSVLNNGRYAIDPIFNGPEVLPSASDKAKIFT